jgi:hypothetical protein
MFLNNCDRSIQQSNFKLTFHLGAIKIDAPVLALKRELVESRGSASLGTRSLHEEQPSLQKR